MTISLKEARETRYWLKLLKESDLVNIDINKCLSEVNEIISILTKIIKTSIKNL